MTRTRSRRHTVLFRAAFVSGIALLMSAQPSAAGFEWRGPLAPPAAPVTAPAAPALSGLEPVISWDSAKSDTIRWQQEAAMPVQPVEAVDSAPVAAPVTAMPVETVVASAAISGFGRDLPLVIALQQVVPAGYQYSFAAGVNPGQTVSWQGGQAWQAVLKDMLAAQNLGYRLQGNVVVIGDFVDEAPAASAPEVPVPVATQAPVPAAPADAAPAETAPVAAKADQIPADMAVAPAASTATPPTADAAPVSIRRQKPSSLLKRLTRAPETEKVETKVEAVADTKADVAAAAAEETTAAVSAPAETAAPAAEPVVIALAPAQGAESATVAPQPALAAPSWHGARGQTLRDTLKEWSDVAGVELYWSIDYDYRLTQDVQFAGTYDEAVARLLENFATVRPQPYGQLHQNTGSPRVLVVKSYDLSR